MDLWGETDPAPPAGRRADSAEHTDGSRWSRTQKGLTGLGLQD
jgi:hypothetical protein